MSQVTVLAVGIKQYLPQHGIQFWFGINLLPFIVSVCRSEMQLTSLNPRRLSYSPFDIFIFNSLILDIISMILSFIPLSHRVSV